MSDIRIDLPLTDLSLAYTHFDGGAIPRHVFHTLPEDPWGWRPKWVQVRASRSRRGRPRRAHRRLLLRRSWPPPNNLLRISGSLRP